MFTYLVFICFQVWQCTEQEIKWIRHAHFPLKINTSVVHFAFESICLVAAIKANW